MVQFRSLDQIDVTGKRVLVRADLNVPTKDGKVTDATRIERLAPTLKELLDRGAKVVLMSHFGRPKGEPNPKYSLKSLAAEVGKSLGGKSVAFATDCVGPEAEKVVAALKDGEIALLENLRYHKQEEANDAEFAKGLAKLGDFYVNDAFSSSHRAHASVEAVAHLLPSAAGRLMQAELEALGKALEAPQRPVAAVVGGAKVSTKLDLLGNLLKKVDLLIIGGGMANTFLFAKGVQVGKSLCERDMADTAKKIADQAVAEKRRIVLPVDASVAPALDAGSQAKTVGIDQVGGEDMILDIGPASIEECIKAIEGCKTVVWNGPVGAFENPPFDKGTNALAQAVAKLTKEGKLLSVAGGGDTVAALAHAGAESGFSYVSAAGGAFLEWLEGKELPGVKALATS